MAKRLEWPISAAHLSSRLTESFDFVPSVIEALATNESLPLAQVSNGRLRP